MAVFNPLDYDIYHLGVSAGKDSTAAYLWLVFESGWPQDRMVISFCDTGNEDRLVYNYLEMLHQKIFPITTVVPPLDFWELAKKKGRFPSRKARFCTQQLKIVPSMRFVLELKRRHGKVLLLTGERRAEAHSGNSRGDLETFSYDDGYGCDKYLPIYEWTLDDVWQMHRRHLSIDWVISLIENDAELTPENKALLVERMGKHGIPRNPLYDMGARRVGCFPCINSVKYEIRAMAHFRPKRIDFIESKEGSLGRKDNRMFSSFFARKTVPPRFRSREITTASGEKMKVATIRDVVRWSRTKWGAKEFDDSIDDVPIDKNLSCDARAMCE